MPKRIGLIAEDDSDIDSVRILLQRVLETPSISSDKFVGKGCGKIMRKAQAWARNLRSKGCRALIVVHDRDRKNRNMLRSEIERSLHPSPIIPYLICIPTEEMEAWLLADPNAIRTSFRLKNPVPDYANPESVDSPKEHLKELVNRLSGGEKAYLNTKHNSAVFRSASIDLIAKKCPSFREFRDFAKSHCCAA
jgi:hypothetical protein